MERSTPNIGLQRSRNSVACAPLLRPAEARRWASPLPEVGELSP